MPQGSGVPLTHSRASSSAQIHSHAMRAESVSPSVVMMWPIPGNLRSLNCGLSSRKSGSFDRSKGFFATRSGTGAASKRYDWVSILATSRCVSRIPPRRSPSRRRTASGARVDDWLSTLKEIVKPESATGAYTMDCGASSSGTP